MRPNRSAQLVKGTAELFGTELAADQEYSFQRCKAAVFTWHGCELLVTGKTLSCYTGSVPFLGGLVPGLSDFVLPLLGVLRSPVRCAVQWRAS